MKLANRSIEIDIIKAIGITLMVMAHSGAPFSNFIELFHMAIFFIASGYVFKSDSSDKTISIWEFIKKKIKQLWLPYFLSNTIFTLLNNFFICTNIYTNNENIHKYCEGQFIVTKNKMSFSEMIYNIINAITFNGNSQLAGATWFLEALFKVSILYCVMDFICKKINGKKQNKLQLLISIGLLLLGYYCKINGIKLHGYPKVFSCYILYYFGVLFKKNEDKFKNLSNKNYIIIGVLSFVILLVLNSVGSISLGSNDYVNPLFLIAASIFGWLLLYSLSIFIKDTIFVRAVVFVGRKTLNIMILHFLSMKLVAYLICFIYKIPYFCVAAFPNLYGDKGLWWILYTIVGLYIPIMLSTLYNVFFHRDN